MAAQPGKLQGWALAAALVVMAAWLAMAGYLLTQADAPDDRWTRIGLVFSSIQAVAFAAAGALFGATVTAQRVEDAKHRADRAEGEAKENATAAANGRALAVAVKTRARSTGGGPERVSRGIGPRGVEREGEDAGEDELAALAERLFPG